MYTDYFGFNDAPFSIAPNPHYLYLSDRHREALAHLLYGISSDGGFILLTGEVGTGKTTVCRCLLEQIPDDVDTAFILNPKLTAVELLATACDDLGVSYPADATIKTLVDQLSRYLLESHDAGRKTVLIIDEAQNLSVEVLEQLRLLTNLETSQRKLLQIILLGQPELLDMLEQPALRQLAQRITARYHLEPLSHDEVASYIAHRLEVAGGNPALFSRAAVARVFRLSGGVPRLVNLICDRALLGTYASNRLTVGSKVINQAAKEIFGASRTASTPWMPAAVAAGLAVATLSTWLLIERSPQPLLTNAPEPVTAAEPTVVATQPLPVTPPQPDIAPSSTTDEFTEAEPIVTAKLIESDINEFTTLTADPLIAVEGDTSREQALRQLLRIWVDGATGVGEDACEAANREGLGCLSKLGSLRDLEYLNLPAVIQLTIADLPHFVTLTTLDDNTATIVSSHGRYRITRADLLSTWDGYYTLLWRTPTNYRQLVAGDRGDTVLQLSRQLAQANDIADARTTSVFDSSLERQLKQFQVSVGLAPDGIAGAHTWIRLNAASGLEQPTLSAGDQN